MPVGDSITYRTQKDTYDKVQNYRYDLWKMLIDEEIDFEYVGRQKDEYVTKWPQYFKDYKGHKYVGLNEGYRGERYASVNNKMHEALKTLNADWVLVYLGANDIRGGASPEAIAEECKTTIKFARENNPNRVIFIGLLVSCADASALKRMNDAQKKNCAALSTSASPVYAVDFGSIPTADGCHVNATGAQKMAAGWLKAIQTHLKNQGAVAVVPRNACTFKRAVETQAFFRNGKEIAYSIDGTVCSQQQRNRVLITKEGLKIR
jgi:lysophospholipase L1-like esterase